MSISDGELEQLRTKARELAERARSDQTFKEQVQRDPYRTLIAEGLPEDTIPEFLHATDLADVEGYATAACLGTIGCVLFSNVPA